MRHDGQRQHEGDRPRQDADAGHRDPLRAPAVGHHRPAVPAAGGRRRRRAEVRQRRLAPRRVRTAVRRRAAAAAAAAATAGRTRHAPGGRRVLTDRTGPDRIGSDPIGSDRTDRMLGSATEQSAVLSVTLAYRDGQLTGRVGLGWLGWVWPASYALSV